MKPIARRIAVVGTVVVFSVVVGYIVLQAQVPQQSCGNEGEAPCSISLTNAQCDTGLARTLPRVCGCLLRGFFGNCLIPRLCTSCESFTRRLPSINAFANSWIDWALRNQRELAQDEPVNWVMHLGTHNSFNSVADGHGYATFPNQFYSMTDQLRSGARMLSIDLYQVAGAVRLCHSFNDISAHIVCALAGNPFYSIFPPSYRYFASGIKEVRNWLLGNRNEILFLDLEDWVFEGGGAADEVVAPLQTHLGTRILNSPLQAPPGFTTRRWPTRREMLAAGRQVIILDNSGVLPLNADNDIVFKEGDIVGSFGDDWLARNMPRYPDCKTSHVLADPPEQASLVVEERELGAIQFGQLDAADVASAAECNNTFIILDKFSSSLPHVPFVDAVDFSRQAAAVWSWKVGDRGQNGDCAMLDGAAGRWESTNCEQARRFACAKPRSESGLDPLAWEDRLGEDWRVTAATGPWEAGHAVCMAEFPGYVFGVPVNGYQHRKLKDVNTSAGDIWLNYSQRDVEGRWVIGRVSSTNAPPIANAGPDQTIECGRAVVLDGRGSRDPEGEALTYTWTGPFGTLTGARVATRLPGGTHAITLTVRDANGGSDSDSVSITLPDTTPPRVKLALSPPVLWPAQQQLVPVRAMVSGSDTCGSEPPVVELVSVASNAGNPSADILGAETGTDDREFELRAAMPEQGVARIYAVTYRATDFSGNAAEVTVNLAVGAPSEGPRKR